MTAELGALTARHAQLIAVLDQSLREPLLRMRSELGVLADDPAGNCGPRPTRYCTISPPGTAG
ncbi:hypothetical protein NKH77_26045 [Streptomyces sp. M19]